MAQTLLTILADFDTQLADSVAIGDTTATIASATDDDGVAIPAGTYGFTIDAGNSSKEYIIATVSSTALTAILSINRQGVTTSGFVRGHRRGAKVTVTDWAILSRILKNLNGTTGFNSLVKLGYDADPSITSSDLTKFATVQFVIDTAIAGAPDATEATKGITKLSVTAASASNPIAVGDNDPRVPTTGENDALAGTSGTPSASNLYVTANDESRNYGTVAYAASATGNDAYVITLSPAPTSLVNGMIIRVKFDVVNTGAATLNVNGLGALSMVTGVSTALSTGNIVAGMIGVLVYNSTGTVWQLLNPQTPDNVYATVAVSTSTTTNGITDDAATTTITTFKTGRLLLTFNGQMASNADSQNYSFLPQIKVGSTYYGGGTLDHQSGDDARVFPGSFSVITDSLAAGVYTIRGALNFSKGFSTTSVSIGGNIQAITL